jgi:hypothetical protein
MLAALLQAQRAGYISTHTAAETVTLLTKMLVRLLQGPPGPPGGLAGGGGVEGGALAEDESVWRVSQQADDVTALMDMASISYSLHVFDKLFREQEEGSFACYNPEVAAPDSAGALAATDSEKARIHDLVLMRAKVILSARSLASQRVGLGIGGAGGREGSGSGAAVAEEMRAVVKLLRSVGMSGGGGGGAQRARTSS